MIPSGFYKNVLNLIPSKMVRGVGARSAESKRTVWEGVGAKRGGSDESKHSVAAGQTQTRRARAESKHTVGAGIPLTPLPCQTPVFLP